jgi:GNAT superfamily N-acetyltransferase
MQHGLENQTPLGVKNPSVLSAICYSAPKRKIVSDLSAYQRQGIGKELMRRTREAAGGRVFAVVALSASGNGVLSVRGI